MSFWQQHGWWLEIGRLALASLAAHKLRGALTVVGIVIGITSVVGMVSLVEGLNQSMRRQLDSLGSDTIRIRRFDPGIFVGELPDSLRKRKQLTEHDAEVVRDSAPALLGVSVSNRTTQRMVYGGHESRRTDIIGIDRWYLLVTAQKVDDGRPFTDAEVQGGARVALIGADVQKELFSGVDPVGQSVRIGAQRFQVRGVLAERGKFIGQSLDNQVLVPALAVNRYFGNPRDRIFISAKPASPEATERAIEQITEALRRSRGLRPQDENDFAVVTQNNLLNLFNQLTGALFMVMVAIASVALLVGGVGVMNIMLVSVTERTREIGVRKALGATRRQILTQFLAEAMVLTGGGGVLGIIIGVGVGKLVDLLTPVPSFVPLWAFVSAFVVSVGVGLFFGMWPAVRASRMDPVEALRYE